MQNIFKKKSYCPENIAFIFFIFVLSFCSYSQENENVKKIELIQANSLEFDKNIGDNVRRLIGNVIFKHEGALMYCDSAYLYVDTNKIEAFGKIHIEVDYNTNIYGDFLEYNGNTKIAEIHNNVKLIDDEITLTTQHLTHNLKTDVSYYHTGGKIVDKKNVLTSQIGYYYSENKNFYFRNNVVLVNPDYTMYSDTLMYNTVSETAYFYGPTTINSDENVIYCENGWYDTKKDISQFDKNAYLQNKEQKIKGDSMYYDRSKGLGYAFDNIVITDTVNDFIITGNYAKYLETERISVVTDSAVLIIIDKADSLYLHADTLKSISDSADAKKHKTLFAYHKVKFYKNDLQGMADSMVYLCKDSMIALYENPILWSDSMQMLSDSIHIMITDNQIKTITFYNSAFITSQIDTLRYNQIKGKLIIAYLTDNEIKKIFVSGNAESFYFLQEDDGSLIGSNKSESSSITMTLSNKKMEKITFLEKPDATLFPPKELPTEETFLKDFKRYDKERPSDRLSIFNW